MPLYVDGLVPDCSNSSVLAVELPQSCTEPLVLLLQHIYGSKISSTSVPIGYIKKNISGLVQDCSNSSVLAMQLLQSCTKPLV